MFSVTCLVIMSCPSLTVRMVLSVQFLSIDLFYHSISDLTLDYVLEKILDLQANALNARVNIFIANFLFNVNAPPQSVIDKLNEIRSILLSHHKGNIVA